MEYHLQYFGPNKANPHWPQGGWSVYQISGDQIAQRITFGSDGRALERHSWCGYLGIGATLADAVALIEKDKSEHA